MGSVGSEGRQTLSNDDLSIFSFCVTFLSFHHLLLLDNCSFRLNSPFFLHPTPSLCIALFFLPVPPPFLPPSLSLTLTRSISDPAWQKPLWRFLLPLFYVQTLTQTHTHTTFKLMIVYNYRSHSLSLIPLQVCLVLVFRFVSFSLSFAQSLLLLHTLRTTQKCTHMETHTHTHTHAPCSRGPRANAVISTPQEQTSDSVSVCECVRVWNSLKTHSFSQTSAALCFRSWKDTLTHLGDTQRAISHLLAAVSLQHKHLLQSGLLVVW